MVRIKIDLPEQFPFSTSIPVRITDLNYGNHVGNDAVLSIIHEARMQYLGSMGYSELDFAGAGMIMSDAGIEFKKELFYGDVVLVSVTSSNLSKIGFDIYYKLETINQHQAGRKVLAAVAKTGMICYDYTQKKIMPIPEEAKKKLQQT